jgi:hypothetical protein
MSIWTWIAIAAFSWIGFSLLVGLTIARVVRSISRRISDILDAEPEAWVFARRWHAGSKSAVASHRRSPDRGRDSARSREDELVPV